MLWKWVGNWPRSRDRIPYVSHFYISFWPKFVYVSCWVLALFSPWLCSHGEPSVVWSAFWKKHFFCSNTKVVKKRYYDILNTLEVHLLNKIKCLYTDNFSSPKSCYVSIQFLKLFLLVSKKPHYPLFGLLGFGTPAIIL